MLTKKKEIVQQKSIHLSLKFVVEDKILKVFNVAIKWLKDFWKSIKSFIWVQVMFKGVGERISKEKFGTFWQVINSTYRMGKFFTGVSNP